jgi:hypothetical protein
VHVILHISPCTSYYTFPRARHITHFPMHVILHISPCTSYYTFPRARHTFFSVYYVSVPLHALSFNHFDNINGKAQNFKTHITFKINCALYCDYNQAHITMNVQKLCKIMNRLHTCFSHKSSSSECYNKKVSNINLSSLHIE